MGIFLTLPGISYIVGRLAFQASFLWETIVLVETYKKQ